MTKFRSILALILGDKTDTNPEIYFLRTTFLSASIFLFVLIFIHLLMNLTVAPVYFAGGSSLLMLFMFFIVRLKSYYFISKLIVTFWGIIFLDLTWHSKFQSLGPVLFFIFAFGILILWVWEGRVLIVMMSLYFINIIVIFLIEYHSTDISINYPDNRTRAIDIYLSFLLYFALFAFVLYNIKRDFIRQREKAERSDKLKSAFLANMSHEIRTPMNAVLGFSELIENESDDSKRLYYGNIIRNSGDSLLKLINDIIDISKIDAGELQISFSNFSLKELFDELYNIYSAELIKRGKLNIKLSCYLPDSDYIIFSDKVRVRQILYNLLNNAMKFTSQGSITLECKKSGNELIFSVTDTGTGIPEKDQSSVFDRFTKYDYKGLNTEGTGIGLSIVEKLVRLLNGKIWFKSTWGEGSEFSFTIPFVESAALSVPVQEFKKKTGNPLNEGRINILIVEDDKTSFLLLKEILRPLNLVINHVSNGKDAISFVRENNGIKLVLMDIELPGIDGLEAAGEIKKIAPGVPIIAQTAYAMNGDREKALDAGCDEYITKPLDSKKLFGLITDFLSR